MTNQIQPLCSSVVTKLRSGINLTSVAHCVEELVLNSVDAGASCIAVNLNLPIYQIQVIDNGCGMDLEQLKIIGTRYATSKCHTVEDLQNLKSGGFRGEALSSLKEVSSVLMIESRAASSKETSCKIFTQGHSLPPKKSLNSRPSKGTTVSVHDFMYNMPVRRNSFSSALDLEESRKLIQGIALMHPDISFTLKNDATGEICLQVKKSSSLCHSFCQMFGKNKSTNLKNVEYKDDGYEISGCVSTDCHINKDLQFLYVNKRRVLHTKLHKIINNILNKSLNSKQKSKYGIYKSTPEGYSPTKTQTLFCICVLNISCPYDKYDIIFEPRKTMIEFSEWDRVLNVTENCLVNFMKKENLYVEQIELTVPTCTAAENNNYSSFDTHDCRQGLFSHIAKRFQNDLEPCIEETAADNQKITSVKSNSICGGRSLKSLDEESNLVCLKSDMSGVSVLDSLKMTNVKTSFFKNSSATCAPHFQTEFDIPCRSVFPSKSPVMLRIPIRSTLSDLQAGSSNSDFFNKLKEKFQFSLEKKNKVQESKNNKVCCGLNHKSKVSFKNNSSHKSHLSIYHKKSDATECCNASNLQDKSSQCPSVSSNTPTVIDSQVQNNPASTKDKSFQCPSVSSTSRTRTISRFEFREEQPGLFSKHFKQPGTLGKNTKKNHIEECIAVAESLLESVSSENEFFKAKKLKPSEPLFLENIKDVPKEHVYTCEDIINIDPNEDFMNNFIGNTKGKFTQDTPVIPLTESFRTAEAKNVGFSNFNYKNTSQISLQTFSPTKNGEFTVSTADKYKAVDIYLLSQREDPSRNSSSEDIFVRNISNSDSNSFYSVPIKNNMYEAEINNEKPNPNHKLDWCPLDGNLNMEVDMSSGSGCQENDIFKDHLASVSFDSNADKPGTNTVNLCSFESNCLLTSTDKNFILRNKIIQDLENEILPTIEFQYKAINVLPSSKCKNISSASRDSTINELHAYQANIPPSNSGAKLMDGVNFDSEPFTESLPSVPNPVSSLKDKSQENINSGLSNENFLVLESGLKESQFSELLPINEEGSTKFESPTKTNMNVFSCNILQNGLEDKNVIFDKDSTKSNVEVKNSKDIDCILLESKEVTSSCSSINIINDGFSKTNVIKDKEDSHLCRWKPHAEPETKRVIYIDSVTGNSTYTVPEDPGRLKDNLSEELSKDTNIEYMFNQWENPMFDIAYEVDTIGDKTSQRVPQMYTFLNSYKFSQSTLQSLQVIGQVDCKFIACILQNINKNSTGQKLLALFDQHAVHERIRLEELIKDLHEVDQAGETIVKSSSIFPPLKISFGSEEIRLLRAYYKKLHQIGIHLEIEGESHVCSVNSVPSCLIDKVSNQLRRSREDSLVIIQNTIIEWLSSIVKTRSIPQVLPKTLSSVLNSQACRGAVKFGDPLSLKQCCDLLESLSDCKLPFQCAHGRPSIAPLLDMSKVHALYKKRPHPQLSRLSDHLPKGF